MVEIKDLIFLKSQNNLEMAKSLNGHFYKIKRFGVNLYLFNNLEMNDKEFSKLAKELNLKKYNTNFYH